MQPKALYSAGTARQTSGPLRASMDRHPSTEVNAGSFFTTSRQASGLVPPGMDKAPSADLRTTSLNSTAPDLHAGPFQTTSRQASGLVPAGMENAPSADMQPFYSVSSATDLPAFGTPQAAPESLEASNPDLGQRYAMPDGLAKRPAPHIPPEVLPPSEAVLPAQAGAKAQEAILESGAQVRLRVSGSGFGVPGWHARWHDCYPKYRKIPCAVVPVPGGSGVSGWLKLLLLQSCPSQPQPRAAHTSFPSGSRV